jgi:hypothetical protein
LSEQIEWYCEKCPANENQNCGPFPENNQLFPQVKQLHITHRGWKKGRQPSILELGDNWPKENSAGLMNNVMEWCKRQKKLNFESIQNYLNNVIKNDPKLVKKIPYAFFSAYTNNPINLGIMADTSEGKTYAVIKVAEIFPKNDIIIVGRMSPTALIHQRGILVDPNGNPIEEKIHDLESQLSQVKTPAEKLVIKNEIKALLRTAKNLIDLSDKILLFLEPPNPQLWDILKPILSHDKYEIEYKTTQTDGSLKVKESIIRGFPAVVFCSAKNEASNPIWKEIETRFDIVSPNTEVTKYKEANKFTAQRLSIPDFARSMIENPDEKELAKDSVKEIKVCIQSYCKNTKNPIWNPFDRIIGECFPSNQGITMRQCDRFLRYCNLSTLINSKDRFRIEFETKNGDVESYLISTISDIDVAIDLTGAVSPIPPERLKFLKDIFEPALAEILDDSGITTEKLALKYTEIYKKETTPKKILENYVRPLMDYGILEALEDLYDRRRRLYRYAAKPHTNNLEIIRQRIIEQSNNDDLFIWSYIDELEKNSIGRGKIRAILDPKGRPEGWNLIQKQIVKTSSESNNLQVIHA